VRKLKAPLGVVVCLFRSGPALPADGARDALGPPAGRVLAEAATRRGFCVDLGGGDGRTGGGDSPAVAVLRACPGERRRVGCTPAAGAALPDGLVAAGGRVNPAADSGEVVCFAQPGESGSP